jgi:transposase
MNVAWLLGQIDNHAPESLREPLVSLKQTNRQQQSYNFAKIVALWQEDAEYLPEVFEEAKRRLRVCLRLSRERHHLGDKVMRRREDFYRCRAKEIAEAYGLIVLDKMDLRQLALLEKGDGQPTTLHKNVRHARVVAAVSVLREWIVKQAAKTGAQINIMTVASSTTCHACGTPVKSGPDLIRTCFACGANWDQDENAAINLLRAIEQ